MRRIKKKSVRLSMIGGSIGIMMTIIFSKSPMVLGFIPIASALGALIGAIIDKKRKRST